MRRIIVVAIAALAGLALAAGTQFEPVIDNDAIIYFQGKLDRSETQTLYYSLDVVEGVVTVHLSDKASPSAIAHVFEAIERPSNGVWRNLYGRTTLNRADEQEEDQAKVLVNLHRLANMRTLGSGWAITHEEMSVADAIDAYDTWFSQSGAEMTLDPTNAVAGVRPFNVTGLTDDLRVVFHREGSGVRVYIGYL